MNDEQGSTIYCSRCGAEMKSTSRYCMKCGNLNYDHEDNKDYVYVIDNDSIVHKKEIQIGASSDLYVEVDGLEEDEKVILNPSNQIKDGLAIKIKELDQKQVKK